MFQWTAKNIEYAFDRAVDWFEDELDELLEGHLEGRSFQSEEQRQKFIIAAFLVRQPGLAPQRRQSFVDSLRSEQYTEWENITMKKAEGIICKLESDREYIPEWTEETEEFFAVLEYWRVGEELAQDYCGEEY